MEGLLFSRGGELRVRGKIRITVWQVDGIACRSANGAGDKDIRKS